MPPADNALKKNAEDQVARLMSQLSDLEELREDLDDDEYAETKAETLQQLEEFKASLQKMMSGDITLQDELGAMKMAIQAAVSQAFQTPEVIQMFAFKQPEQLRAKLEQIQEQHHLGKIADSTYYQQSVEIMSALQKLKQTLTDTELSFMKQHMSDSLAAFEAVNGEELGTSAEVLNAARADILRTRQ
uniref:Beta-catenin-interacting ICAT domain-containing protein n=1 Tax=Pyramimonas obovata TaxID=1411642 RepID=A0A7S0RYX4_9CHLO|mmetsp:Transcript_9901/g.20678  ORF Transcript_9901/g.20678 Transcript_9901/m.20678 type:complete len:188 (+) Transcript_9901:85-648(+)